MSTFGADCLVQVPSRHIGVSSIGALYYIIFRNATKYLFCKLVFQLKWTSYSLDAAIQSGVALLAFTVVYVICCFNPEGFLVILERLASACLNITNSLFLRAMISVSSLLNNTVFQRKENFPNKGQ